MEYNKIALDTPDLLAMLKQRGLQVSDEQESLRTLSMVSYFRLACYFRPMEIDKQTHARIWNRRYALKPQMPKSLAGHKWLSDFSFPPDKIYSQLCCIAYLLNAIDSQNTFAQDIKQLLQKYSSVDAAAMGFPKGWKKEPLWN